MAAVKPLGNSNGPGFSVYSDENADPCPLPPQSGEWVQAPSSKGASKENQQKAGVWTSTKVWSQTFCMHFSYFNLLFIVLAFE